MVSATNIMSIPAEKNDFAKGVIHKLVDKIKDPFSQSGVIQVLSLSNSSQTFSALRKTPTNT